MEIYIKQILINFPEGKAFKMARNIEKKFLSVQTNVVTIIYPILHFKNSQMLNNSKMYSNSWKFYEKVRTYNVGRGKRGWTYIDIYLRKCIKKGKLDYIFWMFTFE